MQQYNQQGDTAINNTSILSRDNPLFVSIRRKPAIQWLKHLIQVEAAALLPILNILMVETIQAHGDNAYK